MVTNREMIRGLNGSDLAEFLVDNMSDNCKGRACNNCLACSMQESTEDMSKWLDSPAYDFDKEEYID